jgi:hypothetical protein
VRAFKTLALCLALLLPAAVAAQSGNTAKSGIELPALKTGTLSLGKAGVRNSQSCGGPTPAIEVIFTATTKGRESFEVEGDKITVRVK